MCIYIYQCIYIHINIYIYIYIYIYIRFLFERDVTGAEAAYRDALGMKPGAPLLRKTAHVKMICENNMMYICKYRCIYI